MKKPIQLYRFNTETMPKVALDAADPGPTTGRATIDSAMTEQDGARLRAHRNNIQRYSELMATELSHLERWHLERRLNEEKVAMEALPRYALHKPSRRTET